METYDTAGIVVGFFITLIVYIAPPIIYAFVVKKQKLQRSIAAKVCAITGSAGCLLFIGMRVAMGMNPFGSVLPAVIWSTLAFLIIKDKAKPTGLNRDREWEDPGFGYSIDKPVFAKGFNEQLAYLNSLTTDEGKEINYKFKTVAFGNEEDDIEKREVYTISAEGIEPVQLYFYKEANHTSKGAPKGFRLRKGSNKSSVVPESGEHRDKTISYELPKKDAPTIDIPISGEMDDPKATAKAKSAQKNDSNNGDVYSGSIPVKALHQLKNLHEEGVLTDEEYEAKKKQLLNI